VFDPPARVLLREGLWQVWFTPHDYLFENEIGQMCDLAGRPMTRDSNGAFVLLVAAADTEPRDCEGCGEEFLPARRDQRFCRPACRGLRLRRTRRP
jgi:hypothetical protein